MTKSKVASNTLFNTIKSIFGVVYPIVTFPYISRVLMTDNFGKINFGNSIVCYISLIASLGVTVYAIRECSKVKEDQERLSNVASQILSINVLTTFVAYFVLVILLIFAKPLENYRLLICIQSTNILFVTLGADWLNTAMEDFKYIAVRTVFFQILSLILMFIFINKPEDYLIYAAISVVASSGANIVNVVYRRKFCKLRFTWKMNLKRHLPKIFLLFSFIFSMSIYVNSDVTILGLVRGDREVGLYSTSVKLYQIVNTTIASISWVVMSKLSFYFAKKDYEEINKLLKYSLNFIIVFGFPCICGLEIIAKEIIVMVAGDAYADASLSLRILGFALLCSFISGWLCNMVRIPSGQDFLSLKISLFCALVNVVLNLILIPVWGLNAAAFTTALTELFGLIWGFIVIDKNIKITGLKEMVIAPLIGGIGIICIGYIVKNLIDSSFAISLVTIFFCFMWYSFVMIVSKNEIFLEFTKILANKFVNIKK